MQPTESPMKLAILGAGQVGATLGRGLARAGHAITYGVRTPTDPKYAPLLTHGARALGLAAAVAESDAVILATPWDGTQSAITAAGDFADRPLLDATNPIGPGFALTLGHTDSGGEQVQRWARNARVVKVFNTTGLENMADPIYPQGRAVMPLCGDDDPACTTAAALATDLGFDPIRIGGLTHARLLEPAAMLWIMTAIRLGSRDIAFGLMRR